MWNAFANPYTSEWVVQLLPTLTAAAQLALYVVTGPGGGGLACDPKNLVHGLAIGHAAVSMRLVSACVNEWNSMIEDEAIRKAGPGSTKRGARRDEAAVVSDVVQTAVLLNCAVFVRACREHQRRESHAAARGSSWAPEQATVPAGRCTGLCGVGAQGFQAGRATPRQPT